MALLQVMNLPAHFFLFVLLSITTRCVSCHQGDGRRPGKYDFGSGADVHFRRWQLEQSEIVKGLPLVNGKPVARKEIRDLEKDKDGWTLYILALNWMQYMDQDSQFSYYQIAGNKQ